MYVLNLIMFILKIQVTNKQKMLKSFLQLNLNQKHDKKEYSIKKNKLVLLDNISIDSYKYKSLMNDQYMRSPTMSNIKCHTFKDSSFKHNITGASITTKSSFFSSKVQKGIDQHIPLQSQRQKQIKFDCITYDHKSTNHKLLYQLLMLKSLQYHISFKQSSLNLGFQEQQNINFSFNQPKQLPLTLQPPTKNNPQTSLTITFNYSIPYDSIQHLFMQLMLIKKFQQLNYRIAHFELRNNHISDYNKSFSGIKRTQSGNKKKNDDMDDFTKEIDTCVKLDKTWKIKENIKFKQFTIKNFKQKDVLNKLTRTNYQKKTNQFFVLQIGPEVQLNIIILHRQTDYVLTKTQQKQIQQCFILLKNLQSSKLRINVEFTTSLAQIIQSYLTSSDEVVFVSQYPDMSSGNSSSSSLIEKLVIPVKIGQVSPQQVQNIILNYNKQKQSKLQLQMQKMKTKLRELNHKRKLTQQNITCLMKKYKKGFENIFDSLNYLKKMNISDLNSYKANLQNQISQKQQQISQDLQELKQLNYEMIISQERNEYFKGKMQLLKQNLQEDLHDLDFGMGNNSKTQKSSTNKSEVKLINQKLAQIQNPILNKALKQKSIHMQQLLKKADIDIQLTQTILKNLLQVQQQSQNPYSIQLQRQVTKYSNQQRQKTREKLIKSNEVAKFQFFMEELRNKLTKHEFTKIQQKYLGLISMC